MSEIKGEMVCIPKTEYDAIKKKMDDLVAFVAEAMEILKNPNPKVEKVNFLETSAAKTFLGLAKGDTGTKQLNALRSAGLIKKMRKSRPNKYDIKELEKLKIKIDTGEVEVPRVK